MELKRQYILDVARNVGYETSKSNVRFAIVELSSMKAIEIAAMSDLKINGPGLGRYGQREPGAVLTDEEVIWTDSRCTPIRPGFRMNVRVDDRYPSAFKTASIIQIDRKGGFYFWNIFNGGEKLKTEVIPVQSLLADFRCRSHDGQGIVAHGMRRMMKQQSLLAAE